MFRIPDYRPRLDRLKKVRNKILAHLNWVLWWERDQGTAAVWYGSRWGEQTDGIGEHWHMTKEVADRLWRWRQHLRAVDQELDRIIQISRHYGVEAM